MVFNSIPFLIFFVVVFILYYFVARERRQWQNWILLLASYFFYGYANWTMLALLLVATIIFYYIGIYIPKVSEKNQDRLKVTGVVLGLGLLLYFKYLGFFIDSFAALFDACGLHTNLHSLKIIMPVGISCITFRLISYVPGVYDENIDPEKDFVSFATYVSFFPCILSGPIDRPNTFLPQMAQTRKFDYSMAVAGCRQILWGMFLKIVIADNAALYVDKVWGDLSAYSASTLALAAALYVIQLYADFAGYSDMAIGIGKLLGIRIQENFNYPLFALNIADLWRRWHISLTKWMTDYVYTPLSFVLRGWGKWGMMLAIIVNFVLVGFWHGANWIYGVYGLYHGLLFVPLILSGEFMKKREIRLNRFHLPVIADLGRMLLTFCLFAIGGIIFRSESVSLTWEYLSSLGSSSLFSTPWLMTRYYYIPLAICIVIMYGKEWVERVHGGKDSAEVYKPKTWVRWLWYLSLFAWIFFFGAFQNEQFIYFQF